MKLDVLFRWLILGLMIHNIDVNAQTLLSDIQFAEIEKSKELLTAEDAYTDCWSTFDIDSRMQKKQSSKEELMDTGN